MSNKDKAKLPIGVFDSGVGGISVLAELVQQLPMEKYIYFGDSKNAPYGTRPIEQVRELSLNVARKLMSYGIKALVVACNTATSGGIKELREMLDIPVIGMEPAVKPAIQRPHQGKIAVMATPFTLKEKKFNTLISQWADPSEIIKLPCPGLVEIIEAHGGGGEELDEYIKKLFHQLELSEVSSIVLGCTHYIFIKETIQKIVGDGIQLVDGNNGTVKQVERLLMAAGLLNGLSTTVAPTTEVRLINSSGSRALYDLSKQLLEEGLRGLGWNGIIKYIDEKQ